ncbi:MAG: NosD domain-containing protein, partial [Promethearchaeota archaeon]
HSNTVISNTCNSNDIGISLKNSHNNTVISNTCNSNDIGISLRNSHNNTLASNICSNNRIGINLYESYSNTVANNTFVDNTEHDIVEEFEPEWGFDPIVLLLMGLVGITLLGVVWRGMYRAYVLEWKKWREANYEERVWLEADQEVLLAEERRRRALKEMYEDDINIPLGYRIASWFRKRRTLKHVDVDESLEDDSSD